MIQVRQSEIEIMKDAYGKLYFLENELRCYIIRKMEMRFGPERYYLQTYPEAFGNIPLLFFSTLRTIYPIRNKIAHSQLLSPLEKEKFISSVELLITYVAMHDTFS